MYHGWGPTKHEYPSPRSMREAYGHEVELAREKVSKKDDIAFVLLCLLGVVVVYFYMGVFQ